MKDPNTCQFCGEVRPRLQQCYADSRADGKPIMACDPCHWETCPVGGHCVAKRTSTSRLDEILDEVGFWDKRSQIEEAHQEQTKQEIKALVLGLIKDTRWTSRDSVYTENRRQRDMALDELQAKVEAL